MLFCVMLALVALAASHDVEAGKRKWTAAANAPVSECFTFANETDRKETNGQRDKRRKRQTDNECAEQYSAGYTT